MDKSMAQWGIKRENMVTGFKLSRSMLNSGVLVIVVGMLFFTTQLYIKRGVSGRLRSAADDIGEQFSTGNTNFRQKTPTTPVNNNATEIIDRRIIRTVDLQMQVKNCLHAQDAIIKTVRKFDGLVLNSQIKYYANGSNGTMTFQVLPKDLDAALIEIKTYGEVQNETSKADDVTGQYVDTQARLSNMRTVRDRLSKLAAENTAHVKDVLEVEHELTRVTGEIEAMETRLKYLAQTSAMVTVTVSFYEQPKAARAFSFIDNFRNSVRTSIEVAAQNFNVSIIAIGFLLPIIVWSLAIWGIYLIWRKFQKK